MDGRMEPLPDYFHDWQLARWMGITRDALLEMPVHEVMEAQHVMVGMNRAEAEVQKQAKKGGRKR